METMTKLATGQYEALQQFIQKINEDLSELKDDNKALQKENRILANASLELTQELEEINLKLDLDPELIAQECSGQVYKVFTAIDRSVNFRTHTRFCDQMGKANSDWQGPGWYRFAEWAGSKMPETPPPAKHCGTFKPGWIQVKIQASLTHSSWSKVKAHHLYFSRVVTQLKDKRRMQWSASIMKEMLAKDPLSFKLEIVETFLFTTCLKLQLAL